MWNQNIAATSINFILNYMIIDSTESRLSLPDQGTWPAIVFEVISCLSKNIMRVYKI